MRQSELKAILEDHSLWLGSDGKQGKRADLRYTDLRYTDLRNANLRGADLRNANLRGADLGGVDLRNADLEGANLQEAYLRHANLHGANLHGANLQKAYLWHASLQHAKFTTNFKKVRWFDHTTFSEDQIPWVVLHPRYLQWAHTLKWVKVKADAA